jgi:Uma2 family endonuclease
METVPSLELEDELEDDLALLETLRDGDGDVSEYERERGKPMPNEQHSTTQSNIIVAVAKRYKKKLRCMSELSIVVGYKTAVPDVCVYAYYEINWEEEPPAAKAEPPLLTIEIVSPLQTLATIREKALNYFQHGVQSCWIVQPELQTVSVLHPGGKTRTFDSGMVEDSVVGISIPVAEVFE